MLDDKALRKLLGPSYLEGAEYKMAETTATRGASPGGQFARLEGEFSDPDIASGRRFHIWCKPPPIAGSAA